jgi:hypothetical protein
MNKCSDCGVTYWWTSPYHTHDMQHIFCGAECSLKWHDKQEKDDGE